MSVPAVGGAGFGISGALATQSPARAGGASAVAGGAGQDFGSMVSKGLQAVSQQEFDKLVAPPVRPAKRRPGQGHRTSRGGFRGGSAGRRPRS